MNIKQLSKIFIKNFIYKIFNKNTVFFICQYQDLTKKEITNLNIILKENDLKTKSIKNKILKKLFYLIFNNKSIENIYNGPVYIIYNINNNYLNTKIINKYNLLLSKISNYVIILSIFNNNKLYNITNFKLLYQKYNNLKFNFIYNLTNFKHPTFFLK